MTEYEGVNHLKFIILTRERDFIFRLSGFLSSNLLRSDWKKSDVESIPLPCE